MKRRSRGELAAYALLIARYGGLGRIRAARA